MKKNEMELVAQLHADGYKNVEIAAKIGKSVSTVSRFINSPVGQEMLQNAGVKKKIAKDGKENVSQSDETFRELVVKKLKGELSSEEEQELENLLNENSIQAKAIDIAITDLKKRFGHAFADTVFHRYLTDLNTLEALEEIQPLYLAISKMYDISFSDFLLISAQYLYSKVMESGKKVQKSDQISIIDFYRYSILQKMNRGGS
jgi:predicted transcriptional regulator